MSFALFACYERNVGDSMQFLGYIVGAVILVAGVAISLVRSRRPQLPATLPVFGALPIAELAKYYDREPPVLAWERVRGWQLNETPASWSTPATIDHVVLTPRLLDFCSGRSGRLELDFNFLVDKILQVQFDAQGLPPGLAPPGFGVLRIYTPSGQTLLIGSPQLAYALHEAIGRARAIGG